MNKTRIFLMRHGQTVGNVWQILQGQTHGCLTDEGRRQAYEAASQLKNEKIDHIFVSDLKRAVDTALIVAAEIDVEITATPLLRERDWGDLTGRFIPDLKELTEKDFPENVETREQVRSRVEQFLQMLKEKYSGKSVLIVGHGIVNKVLQSIIFGKPTYEIEKMENAEVRIICI